MTQSVLIIGAGPVGLTLAIELARFGVPLRIVEKAEKRTDKSKALVLWSRTLELLDRQPGGSTPFVEAGFKVDAVSLRSGDRLIGQVSMASVDSPYPYALMLPQSDTERLLAERLASLGIIVEREVEAQTISPREDGVDVLLRHPGGSEETASADWLVGCDGAHSLVRHSVGATFAGETMDSDWLLADVHMLGYPVAETEVSIYWHKDGAFVIFPISPGRYRLLADLPPSSAAQVPEPTLGQVQAMIERRGPPGMTAFDPIWLAGFRINGRKVSSYRWGRAFLCGDAAHVHSPAGGQGMNTGMQDAFNLAWKLAAVAKGRCGEALLNSYSAERSEVGEQVLAAAQRLTVVATMKNPIGQAIRNTVGHLMLGLAPFREAFAARMTEVSVGYPDSPLNAGSAAGLRGPKPGQRIMTGQPFGASVEPRFTLLANESEAVAKLLGRHADLVESSPRRPPDKNGIWLVRPDGYVAAVAHANQPSAIEVILDRLLPAPK